jgi:hypothetical protein
VSSYYALGVENLLILQGEIKVGGVTDMELDGRKLERFPQIFVDDFGLDRVVFCLEFAMQLQPTLFSQITGALYATEFARTAKKFPGAKPARGLTAYDHFLALCFGQLTYRESLRDIVACLGAKPQLLYHMGFRGRVTRTNLAYANQHRDWRLFESLAHILMRRTAQLYATEPTGLDLSGLVIALDSTIISLALNLFPWGYYGRTKQAALKLHLMLSLRGNLPAWAIVTDTHVGDMRMLDHIPIYPGAHYVMDRGYMDFLRLYRLQQNGAFFVVRCKEPVSFKVLASRPVDKSKGFKCDQTVQLKSNWSVKSYPESLRKIRFYDSQNKVMLVLLTNNFSLTQETVIQLYQKRWQIELFFKWIKQHLRLRAFYGRSENAVRCQVWSALCAYLLVAILKKQNRIEKTLNEILQIVSVNIFEQATAAEILVSKNTENILFDEHLESQKCFEFNSI